MNTVMMLIFLAAGPAAAQEWTVTMKAVEGKVTYSRSQESPLGKQADYSGKAKVRGPGQARGLIFNTYLSEEAEGLFRLDYQAEVGGYKGGRPPFQAQGKVRLKPGRPVVAAEVGGWKLVLELNGEAEGPAPRQGTLEARLKCRGASYPANFAYLPNEQYGAVTYTGSGDYERKFMMGLLPNTPGVDGEFKLQYTLQLKEDREALAEKSGELILSPGGPRKSVPAGDGCVFSARAR